MSNWVTWAFTANVPKAFLKCHLTSARGFSRIGNIVYDKEFAMKLLLSLAHPQNKGASRTVCEALVDAFIEKGSPAALLLPGDRSLYTVAAKVLQERHIEDFVYSKMDWEDELSCIAIDGSYKIPMSLVGQP